MSAPVQLVHIPRCPICHTAVTLAADVASATPGFPSSSFWGDEGDRVIRCQAGAWLHFLAGDEHRLAYLRNKAAPMLQGALW